MCLFLFLAMALSGLMLWQLVGLALPMIATLIRPGLQLRPGQIPFFNVLPAGEFLLQLRPCQIPKPILDGQVGGQDVLDDLFQLFKARRHPSHPGKGDGHRPRSRLRHLGGHTAAGNGVVDGRQG